MRRYKRVAGLFLALALIVSACTGSSEAGPGSTDVSGPTETAESETTTTNPDVLPEFSEATRPTVVIPDSDSYTDPVDEIETRYLLYQDAFIYAASAPEADPDDPDLAMLVAEDQAKLDSEQLQALKDRGQIYVLPEETISGSRVKFVAGTPDNTEGNTVFLRDCIVSDIQVASLKDGEILSEEIFTRLVAIEMRYIDGEWRVVGLEQEKRYEEVGECSGDF